MKRKTHDGWRPLLGLLLLAVVSAPALAGDGVIEINQARAIKGGVTPGDTPGFPVTISQPGSYRLTGNLDLDGLSATGLSIAADSVTIDLNGFSIIGDQTFDGISISSLENVEISNGTVTRFGTGVRVLDISSLQGRYKFTNLRILTNSAVGILVEGGLKRDVFVKDSLIWGNGSVGIDVSGAVISGNVVTQNGAAGISCFDCIVTNNRVSTNGGDGITGSECLITENTIRENSSWGLDVSGSGYKGNVIAGNATGTVVGGVELGPNLCDGNTTCP